MRRLPVVPALALTLVLAAGAAACGGDDDPTPRAEGEHSHTGLPAGDGVRAAYVGYAMSDVAVPARPGVPGTLTFRITYQDRPVTDFVTELTKDMHVYVVSTDLSVFRHVHPTMSDDGTWTTNLTLPVGGRYRVVAEFTARDEGGNGDSLVLGTERVVGAARAPVPVPPATTEASADGVTVHVREAPVVGYEKTMELGLSTDGDPASLGTYLGVYAHVSAFNVRTGELVHTHPLGQPETVDGQSVLTFHTGFKTPGDYRVFVQTRVSGVVVTVPITVEVTGTRAPAP